MMAMKAIQAMNLDSYSIEARRIIYEKDLPEAAFENLRIKLIEQACRKECEPLIQMLVKVASITMPTYVMHPDGTLEKDGDGMTDEMRETATELRAQIAAIKWRYGTLAGVPDAFRFSGLS